MIFRCPRISHSFIVTYLSSTFSKRCLHGKSSFHKQTHQKSLGQVKETGSVKRNFKGLLKPFCFTSLVVAGSFTGAIIWQYEGLRQIAKHGKFSSDDKSYSGDKFYGKAGELRRRINIWWNGLHPGQKVVANIIGLNIGVFILWYIPPLRPFMMKYFLCSPFSNATCWPLLLSAFSHKSALHLFINMYVCWSFSSAAVQLFGKEQFVAVYLSGAVISGFSSYVFKMARCKLIPSLGASGAILAIIGAVCSAFPDARLSIAFIDQLIPHSFTADTGMKCIIIFDTLGVLLGWRVFDHAAHLGGLLFGIWYVKYGHKLIWKKREPLMLIWHNIRGKPAMP